MKRVPWVQPNAEGMEVEELSVNDLTDGEFTTLMQTIVPPILPDNLGIEAVNREQCAAELKGERPRMDYRANLPKALSHY